MGFGLRGNLVGEYGFDDADVSDPQRQRTIVVQSGDLAVHRDQPRWIGIPQFVQFAAAAIMRFHKNAPATEFGARVQSGRTPGMPRYSIVGCPGSQGNVPAGLDRHFMQNVTSLAVDKMLQFSQSV